MSTAEVFADFKKNTADHEMKIVRDDGVYRHLSFSKPGTRCFGFDVITWPGHLATTGDMGASVFCRLEDMFQFFRSEYVGERSINPSYWAEKLVANDGDAQRFSSECFELLIKELYDEHIKEHSQDDGQKPEWSVELWGDLTNRVLGAEDIESAFARMDRFRGNYGGFRLEFTDVHDYYHAMMEYSYHLLWRMFAIVHAIRCYDEAKSKQEAA